jgi:hypothetical protein
LPQALVIPKVMTLRTLADVRKLLGHLPADRRKLSRWQGVADDLRTAALGGSITRLEAGLRLVLFMERVTCH